MDGPHAFIIGGKVCSGSQSNDVLLLVSAADSIAAISMYDDLDRSFQNMKQSTVELVNQLPG